MSEITKAIEARQTQIAQLQSEIETLQRAASIMGGGEEATAKATSRPKARAKPKTAAKPQPKRQSKPKGQRKRRGWSAAEKAAIGKRMKKYWAKRRKAKG